MSATLNASELHCAHLFQKTLPLIESQVSHECLYSPLISLNSNKMTAERTQQIFACKKRVPNSSLSLLPKSRRSRYTYKRRAEVAKIRQRGACMRCRLDRSICSPTSPCRTCHLKHQPGHRSKSKRAWMLCVPFSFLGYSIYEESHCDPELFRKLMKRWPSLSIISVKLSFDTKVTATLDGFCSEFARLMSDSSSTETQSSLVGTMLSSRTSRTLVDLIPDTLRCNLSLLLELSSMMHSHGYDESLTPFSRFELFQLKSFAGYNVLRSLENQLNWNVRAKFCTDQLKALLLALLGAMLAIGYDDQSLEPGSAIPHSGLSSNEFRNNREQLLLILSHHLLEVADSLNLLDRSVAKDLVLKDAQNLWNNSAGFALAKQTHKLGVNPRRDPSMPEAVTQRLSAQSHSSNTNHFGTPCLRDPQHFNPGSQYQSYEHVFIHNHGRGSSYRLTWPMNCSFILSTDFLTVIRAHESQDGAYRMYRNSFAWRHNKNSQLDSRALARWQREELEDTCAVCNHIMGIDGVCEPCTFPGFDFMNNIDEGGHLITIKSLPEIFTPDPSPDYHYSITESPLESGAYLTPPSNDQQQRKGVKIGQWICNCTPLPRLALVKQTMDAGQGYDRRAQKLFV